MKLRQLTEGDHAPIVRVLDDWWGGRHMSDMLPKLFFTHFHDTSLIIENDDGGIAAFLVGFFSPAQPDAAYIHFVGVNPAHRKDGLGRMIYKAFFERMRAAHRSTVSCVTSPMNGASIAFHTRMGFVAASGDARTADGVPYTRDYDGPGEHRVLFSKSITS